MTLLSANETARRLPYPALADGLAAVLNRRAAMTAPERRAVPLANSTLLLMPAASRELTITKLVTVHPENAALGLPTVQGVVVVTRGRTGELLGILDGATVTERRTAALSLLAARTLAPVPGGPLLVVGAGVQARAHIEAFREGLGIEEVWVGSRTPKKAHKLVAHAQTLGLDARFTESPAEVAATVSLIVTATTSRTPVISGPLRPDALICAVGAFTPEMAEIAPEIVSSSRVVVDTLDGAKTEAGDLIQAAAAGWDFSRATELATLLDASGSVSDRPTVFKSVGQALFDLAAAHVAFGVPVS